MSHLMMHVPKLASEGLTFFTSTRNQQTYIELYLQMLLVFVMGLLTVYTAHAAPVNAPVNGEVQRITVNNPNDHWSGGTITVGGTLVTIPRNLLIDLPANRMTLQQLFVEAPASCVSAGQTGLAKGDSCNTTGSGGIVSISATRNNGGNVIAGDVFIQKGIEAITGIISYIDYHDGYFRLNGTPGDAATGVMVRLNDPDGRHTVQQGLGCASGSNCSADPRFTLDADNYTNAFSTGYPLCIPSTEPRTTTVGLPAQPGIAALPLGTIAQANLDGTGDALCPATNRIINGGQPVNDSRLLAPILLGDSTTAEGNFEFVNGVRFLSAHTTGVAVALSTKNQVGQPDYLTLDEVGMDAAGFQNERIRTLIIGFSTLVPDVVVYSLHYDPINNSPHEFPLATVRGCDTAAGAGTCGQLGLVTGAGGNIFKIRYDIDFLAGAKAKLNPCAHLRADPRMGTNICPAGGIAETNTAEMMGILSPLPHEIITKTGHLLVAGANPPVTLDIRSNVSPNGQYLFPLGMNLGGIVTPEFVEIDLNALGTAVSFSGIPWDLDRRLSPGGCIDTNGDGIVDCEATAQPLEPFPFEGTDPRTLATLPFGQYADPNFTASPIVSVRNRVLSFVDGITGKFNGNTTVLAWPPVDPAAQSIGVTPDVNLSCTADTAINSPPIAVNDNATTAANTPVSIAVLTNDNDPDGNTISVVSVTSAAGGTVTGTANSVTFAPNAGFSGVATFSYTITDGIATATASVSVTVLPAANVAPIARADTASTNSGVPVTIAVLANDTDANGDALSVTSVSTNPLLGTATSNGNMVIYTPVAGTGGVQQFTYVVSDGKATATGNVAVTVAEAKAESLAVATAELRVAKGEWRVSGTSTVIGAAVTVIIGTNLTGPVLGIAEVDATGAWALRLRNSTVTPDASRTISVKSTGGAIRLAIPTKVR